MCVCMCVSLCVFVYVCLYTLSLSHTQTHYIYSGVVADICQCQVGLFWLCIRSLLTLTHKQVVSLTRVNCQKRDTKLNHYYQDTKLN